VENPKPTGLREEAEIRKLDAETAEIEARTFHIRIRTALFSVTATFLIIHLTIGGSILSEHGDLVGRLLP
jgi:hypothetical protein